MSPFVLPLLLSGAFHQERKALHVFAAASLREPLQAIARRYEGEHPGLKVQLTFAGSQQLAAQINAGAKCDVFAAASWQSLGGVKLKEPGLIFAKNRLTLVAPKGSRALTFKGLSSVKRIVLAAKPVPAGQYAQRVLELAAHDLGSGWLAGVNSHVVSHEQDVRSVLAKVQIGEADAGIVYVTDALSAKGKVETFAIPAKYNVVADYPVGIPSDAPDKQESRHFIHALTDPSGQAILKGAGFGSPFEPAAGFSLEQGSTAVIYGAAKFKELPLVAFSAVGPGRKTLSFKGWAVSSLRKLINRESADIVGADNYRVTIPKRDLLKGYLVAMPDGNYQLIIPGSSPANWVKWLRSIQIR